MLDQTGPLTLLLLLARLTFTTKLREGAQIFFTTFPAKRANRPTDQSQPAATQGEICTKKSFFSFSYVCCNFLVCSPHTLSRYSALPLCPPGVECCLVLLCSCWPKIQKTTEKFTSLSFPFKKSFFSLVSQSQTSH